MWTHYEWPANKALHPMAARAILSPLRVNADVMPMTTARDSFFLWTAVAIAATVFAGFWFTYFGPMFSGGREPSAPVVHLHGWTFFA